jgi:hypothetical protein
MVYTLLKGEAQHPRHDGEMTDSVNDLTRVKEAAESMCVPLLYVPPFCSLSSSSLPSVPPEKEMFRYNAIPHSLALLIIRFDSSTS